MEIMNPFEFAMMVGAEAKRRRPTNSRYRAFKSDMRILEKMGPKPATEYEKLQCKIMDLEEELVRLRNENGILKDSLDYMPDMPGYHRAKESFEALSDQPSRLR
jgi:predicted nuclease with TOPRIM domain